MSNIQFIKNGRTYTDELLGDNDLHFFQQDLTNLYLDKYNEMIGETVVYDDLTSITLYKNNDNITRLPNSLKHLYIKSTTLTHLPISDIVAENIETIVLDYTNMEHFPDISKCHKLKSIAINHSNLSKLVINTLPRSLIELNVRFNNISSVNISLFTYRPKIKFNLSYNQLSYNKIDNILNRNSEVDIKMQNRYKFITIDHENINAMEIRNFVNNQNNRNTVNHNNDHDNDTLNRKPTKNILENNEQTVHLSSINKSIISSYDVICKYIKDNNLLINNDYDNLVSEIKATLRFKYDNTYTATTVLNEKLNSQFIHSILNIRYMELLSNVWSIIKYNTENHDNLIERLYYELDDSYDMCFTGCMNRLINVLVGFIDGVVVSINLKEELQMSIQTLIDNFNKNKINYKTVKEELITLLNYEYDVDTKDPNNIISDEYKKSWIEAFKDYKPDPILCKFNKNIFATNNITDKHTFYIDYNNIIYKSEDEFDNEINPIGIIIDVEQQTAEIYSYVSKDIDNFTNSNIRYPKQIQHYHIID